MVRLVLLFDIGNLPVDLGKAVQVLQLEIFISCCRCYLRNRKLNMRYVLFPDDKRKSDVGSKLKRAGL